MQQDTESFFQAKDAARLISSSSSEVARLGQVIIPDIPSTGRGYRSLYSFRNLVEMRLGEELAHFGVSWKKISRYIDALRKSHGRWLDNDGLDGWLVLDRVWEWGAGTTLETAMDAVFKNRPQDVVIAVNVAIIKRGIRSRDRNGDSLTDGEFKTALGQVEESHLTSRRASKVSER